MNLRTFPVAILAFGTACALAGCSADTMSEEGADEQDVTRAATATVELSLDADGKCKLRNANPSVKFDRVVRLKNVGTKPIVALITLWDNIGGMPSPEGGDIAPGQFVSVKMSTKWWVLNDDPSSRDWSTPIVCRKGSWSDNIDFDEVGKVKVSR